MKGNAPDIEGVDGGSAASGNGIGPVDRNEVARAFGAALRTARMHSRLSQEELALEGDFDRTYPSLLERGLRTPTIFALLRLAQAMRTDPIRLFADTVRRLRQKEE